MAKQYATVLDTSSGDRYIQIISTGETDMARIALTKSDKARVIIAALYNMQELPAADHKLVVKEARRPSRIINERHKIALNIFAKKAAA
jgi:transketolase C-terminal domain/subunit